MSTDYGLVVNYSDRGFGFVSRSLRSSANTDSQVFFHVRTIRRRYPQLADTLDGGSYSGVGFWYETGPTAKGERVRELWLKVEEMPDEQRTEVRDRVTRVLQEEEGSLSAAFAEAAQQALGKAEYERLRSDREQRLRKKQEAEADRQRLAEEEQRKRREAERHQQTAGAGYFFQQAAAASSPRAAGTTVGPRAIETKVVGVTFEGRQAAVGLLSVGEQVRLRREPTNPYDRNAIRVERANGQQIGYINRHEASSYAPRLDGSAALTPATVVQVTRGYSSFSSAGVRIRFVLPEAPGLGPAPVRDFDDNWEA